MPSFSAIVDVRCVVMRSKLTFSSCDDGVQLPKKSAGDSIALYYVWKKHGSHAKPRLPEGNRSPSDDYFGLTGPDVSNETLTLLDRLKSAWPTNRSPPIAMTFLLTHELACVSAVERQLCMQDYFDAARSLCPPRPSSHGPDRKRLKAMELYGLQRLPHTHRAITGTSPLKSRSVLGPSLWLEPCWFMISLTYPLSGM